MDNNIAVSYDANGNISEGSRTTNDGWLTYDYRYQTGTNKAQLVDRAHYLIDDTLTYDRNGNLIYDSGKKASMVYDPYDRLIMTRVATDLGADTILYGYNASGVRIYKAFRHHFRARCYDPTIKEGDDPDPDPEPIPLWCIFSRTDITYYDLAGEKILRERTTGVQLDKSSNYIYSGNNRIAMRDEQNRLHYFLTDHLGSTRVVIDSTGLVEDKYWYFCYGGTWNEEVSLNQPYRYTAKPLDSEAGLNIYYYGARYYDADLGRFLALDPAASKYPSLSPYVYCANNPLKSVDPDGATSMDRIVGASVAMFDNASAIDLRGKYTPTDATDYNAGQDWGDAASAAIGTAEIALGGGFEVGGGAVTLATGGLSSEVTVPVMGAGAALVAHGAFNSVMGTMSLAMQKGRVPGGGGDPKGGTYNLTDPATGDKVHTGQTGDLSRRKSEHARDPVKGRYQFEVDRRSDSRAARRGREQANHDKYKPALNKNRPISKKNPNYEEYMREGKKLD